MYILENDTNWKICRKTYCYVLHITIEKAVIKTLLVVEVLLTLTITCRWDSWSLSGMTFVDTLLAFTHHDQIKCHPALDAGSMRLPAQFIKVLLSCYWILADIGNNMYIRFLVLARNDVRRQFCKTAKDIFIHGQLQQKDCLLVILIHGAFAGNSQNIRQKAEKTICKPESIERKK